MKEKSREEDQQNEKQEQSDYDMNCIQCGKRMPKNKLARHIQKHYKKKPRKSTSIINNNFWGWNSYSRTRTPTYKRKLATQNKSGGQNQKSKPKKPKIKGNKMSCELKHLAMSSKQPQVAGKQIGGYQLKQRKEISYTNFFKTNNSESQQQRQKYSMSYLNQGAQNQVEQNVGQLKFRLSKNKNYTQILEKELLMLRNKVKYLESQCKQQNNQLKHLRQKMSQNNPRVYKFQDDNYGSRQSREAIIEQQPNEPIEFPQNQNNSLIVNKVAKQQVKSNLLKIEEQSKSSSQRPKNYHANKKDRKRNQNIVMEQQEEEEEEEEESSQQQQQSSLKQQQNSSNSYVAVSQNQQQTNKGRR